MKILVLNCGSSSLKYQLINMETEDVLASGKYERIGEDEAFITHKVNGQKIDPFDLNIKDLSREIVAFQAAGWHFAWRIYHTKNLAFDG